MLTTLALPLAAAATFTAGAFAIHKGERYARQITVILSATATALFMLTMIGGLIQAGDQAEYRSIAKPPGWVPATPVAQHGQTRAPAHVPMN